MHSIFVIIIVPFTHVYYWQIRIKIGNMQIYMRVLHEKKMNFNEQKALISLDKLNLFSIISNRAFAYLTDVQAEAIDYHHFVNFIFNRYSTLKMLRKIHT
ncbi:hypothetical protein T03_17071 [Trichinella britovi]|uniref:Uncharacterized protein n=1 Tax=Trichinella britovi TaxID=45882 RepID=A0A0V1CSE6_TRIBR|nr:hypothetical protein T03_17071 [Trichinella britovi]